MKFKRKEREELGINLTPLIDVVFLLLIFFMVTTTFTRETRLSVNLPEAEGQPDQPMEDQVEILVSQNGNYSINGRLLVNNRLDTLMAGLEEITQGQRDSPMVLIADAEVEFQAVVSAMDAIGRSGFYRLSIVTRRPGEDAGTDGAP